MKPEQREKLSKEAADKRPKTPDAPRPPLATETPATAKPTQQIRVTVGKPNPSSQDALATKGLIEAYQTKDGFKCPRCPYSTTSTDEFIDHIAEEINKSLATLGR